MFKTFYIADNTNDLFNEGISITENGEGLEIPPLPTEAQVQETTQVPQQTLPSEGSFIMNKFAVSIGVMFLCIIILTVILTLYKKFFMNNNHGQEFKISETSSEKDALGLECPDNINDCIKAFLLRTM